MFSKNNTVDTGPLLVILIILIVIVFSVFYYFKFSEENNQKDILKIIDKEEIKKTEVDIAEIEKRLDELDIELDDVLRELEL